MPNVSFEQYAQLVEDTRVYPETYAVIYPSLGLANEAGEVLGKVKKALRDNNIDAPFTPQVISDVADELGDVLWYITCLARDLGVSLDEIVERNYVKLTDRKARNVLKGSGDKR
jgi:NTP pyrophosphatase (non-canonical NTP hydrolase)